MLGSRVSLRAAESWSRQKRSCKRFLFYMYCIYNICSDAPAVHVSTRSLACARCNREKSRLQPPSQEQRPACSHFCSSSLFSDISFSCCIVLISSPAPAPSRLTCASNPVTRGFLATPWPNAPALQLGKPVP